jgi:prephenate dehydrogenase
MKRFAVGVERLLAAIERGDRRRLVELLTRAKEARDALGS